MLVTVWNSEKAEGITQYDLLLKFEDEKGGISTTIEVNDENQLHSYLEATYNETDVELEYHIHPEDKSEHKYDLSPLDNNLYQFARMLSVFADTGISETEKHGIAGLLGMELEEVELILERAKKVEKDLTLLQDEDPMVTRRARATINGDKDYTVNYDDGIEIVATDGQALYDIDLNDDGSLNISVSGCTKHKGKMLDSVLFMTARSQGMYKVFRPEYKGWLF